MNQAEIPVKSSSALKRYLPLAILVAVAALVFFNGWHKFLSLEQIAANRDALRGFVSANAALALLTYVGLYVVVVALSLPGGLALTIAGGFLFGWQIGGAATVVAATTGATILFMIARTSFGETLAAKAGPWLEKLSAGFRENALNYLLFLRLVPAFPFWLVNLAPAVLGVPLTIYVIGTFIGIIPGTFAFSFVGAGLDSVIDAQQAVYQECLDKNSGAADAPCSFSLDAGSLVTKELLIAFAALGVVAIIPVLIKRFRSGKETEV